MQEELEGNLQVDFQRLYSIFDSEFIAKDHTAESLSKEDKVMDNAISKDSIKLFLNLMLCPDFPEKDEEKDPLEEVYALKKDNLLDESILNMSSTMMD